MRNKLILIILSVVLNVACEDKKETSPEQRSDVGAPSETDVADMGESDMSLDAEISEDVSVEDGEG